jgi:hypothetical protein
VDQLQNMVHEVNQERPMGSQIVDTKSWLTRQTNNHANVEKTLLVVEVE